MWTIPVPDGSYVPNVPLGVVVPGLGPVLVLLAFAVATALAWLIGTGVRLSERRVTCPVDGTVCNVVSDEDGRLVSCHPAPAHRGIDDCDQRCLAA